MAQRLGALAALSENPGLIPSAHRVDRKYVTPFPRDPKPSPASGTACTGYIDIHIGKHPRDIINLKGNKCTELCGGHSF